MHSENVFAARNRMELSAGSQIALFGFRSCALGHTKCCCLVRKFQDIFGEEAGGKVLYSLLKLAQNLGNDGKRVIRLSGPETVKFTHDEASVLSALAAAQADDFETSEAHLNWLLARPPNQKELNILIDIVNPFAAHGLTIEAPERANHKHSESQQQGLSAIG